MKQRLGLALAIMASPDLLVLDEPINGLDPVGIVEIRDILTKLNREKNITIIISSHILTELAQLATTYGFINNGQLVEQISAKALEEKFKNSLSIKVNNAQKAAVIIEGKLGCSGYEVLNGNEIRMYEMLDKPDVVAEAIVIGGVKLYAMQQIGSNLEEYFIDLIGLETKGHKNIEKVNEGERKDA
jgi:ABC-type multidrug transport system, ATPase component